MTIQVKATEQYFPVARCTYYVVPGAGEGGPKYRLYDAGIFDLLL